MSSSPLEVTVLPDGATAILLLRGDVNGAAQVALERAYGEAVACGATTLLLDFADVDYINSTGIALLVGLLSKARAGAQQVHACHLDAHYREIFTITRLSDFMTIVDDEPAPGPAPAL